jgi:hypothetical protein
MAFIAVRLHPCLILLLVGMGLGVKATYGYALPGAALLWLLRRRDEVPPAEPRAVRLCVALGCAGLSLGAFWYLRNLVWFGNPIHPVGVAGLIAKTGEKKIQFGPSFRSLYLSISDLVESRITDQKWPFNTLLINISGWGPVSLSCGVPSLIASLRGSADIRKLAAGFVTAFVSVLLLVNHDPWCFRFVSFFPALFAIAIAWMCEKIRETLIIGALAAVAQFALTVFPGDLRPNQYLELYQLSWRDRSVGRLVDAWTTEASVAYFVDEPVHNRGESYLLYRPDYSCRVVYPRATSPQDLVEQMRRESVSVVYVSLTSFQPPKLIEDCLRLGLLRPLRGRFFILK